MNDPLISAIDAPFIPPEVLTEVRGLTQQAIDQITPTAGQLSSQLARQAALASAGPVATVGRLSGQLAGQLAQQIAPHVATVGDLVAGLKPSVTTAAEEASIRANIAIPQLATMRSQIDPITYDGSPCHNPVLPTDPVCCGTVGLSPYSTDLGQGPESNCCVPNGPQKIGGIWYGGCGSPSTPTGGSGGDTGSVVISPPGSGGNDTLGVCTPTIFCDEKGFCQHLGCPTAFPVGSGSGPGDTTPGSSGGTGTGTGTGGTGTGANGGTGTGPACNMNCSTVNLTVNAPASLVQVFNSTLPAILALLAKLTGQDEVINVVQNQSQSQSQSQSQQQTGGKNTEILYPILVDGFGGRAPPPACCPTRAELVDLWTAKFYPGNSDWVEHALSWSHGQNGDYLSAVYHAASARDAFELIETQLSGDGW